MFKENFSTQKIEEIVFFVFYCLLVVLAKIFEKEIFNHPLIDVICEQISITTFFQDSIPHELRKENSHWLIYLFFVGCLVHLVKHFYFHLRYWKQFINTSLIISSNKSLFLKDFFMIGIRAIAAIGISAFILHRNSLELNGALSQSISLLSFWALIMYVISEALMTVFKYFPSLIQLFRRKR